MTQLEGITPRGTFAGTDQRWLGSREGMDTCRTITLDHDAWQGKVENGRLKGGEPVAFNTSTETWVPYTSGGSNGTNQLRGFLRNDMPFRVGGGDKTAALLTRGRIVLKYLPSPVTMTATRHANSRFEFIDPDAE